MTRWRPSWVQRFYQEGKIARARESAPEGRRAGARRKSRHPDHSYLSYLPLNFWVSLLLLLIARLTPSAPRSESAQVKLEWKKIIPLLSRGPLAWIFLAYLVFGISDGLIELTSWKRVTEFHLSAGMAFGIIQATLSLSRLLGSEAWGRSKFIESKIAPGVSLLIGSLFFIAFSFNARPELALPLWFARIFAGAAFYSTVKKLVITDPTVRASTATVLSATSVVSNIGIFMVTGLIGFGGVSSLNTPALIFLGGVVSLVSSLLFLKAGFAYVRGEQPGIAFTR